MNPDAFANLSGPNAGITGAVQSTVPLASTWHGAQSTQRAGIAQPQLNTGPAPDPSGFFGKLEKFGSESAHITEGAAHWLGAEVWKGVAAPIKFAENVGHGLVDNYESSLNASASTQLTNTIAELNKQYKSGQMSDAAYKASLKSITQSLDQLDKQQQTNRANINAAQTGAYVQGINLAADVVSVMTMGTGGLVIGGADKGVMSAAAYVFTKMPGEIVAPMEEAIASFIQSRSFATALDEASQVALKDGIFNTALNAAKDTTIPKMVRSAAVNTMLKFPLTFSAFADGAQQSYQELATGDYPAAIKTAAFNALLLGSGGMIGLGMKALGTGIKVSKVAVFGADGYVEQFAKRLGKDPEVMKALLNKDPELAKNFSAMAQTNINGMKGDISAAVDRHIAHFWNTATPFEHMTEEQLLTDSNHYANTMRDFRNEIVFQKTFDGLSKADAQKVADKYALGRWTTFDKNALTAEFKQMEGASRKELLAKWNQLKLASPSAAFANNPSLNNQITDLIRSTKDIKKIVTGIHAIETQAGVDLKDPLFASRKMRVLMRDAAQKGYVLITPVVNQAPFREGNLADIYATQIAPKVGLGYIGHTLTAAGLSPERASERVGQMMTTNLDGLLKPLDIAGHTEARTVLGKLSSYANGLKLPVTDLRQLDIKDIQTALKLGKREASQIRNALADAYVQMPLAIRGAGDHLYDNVLRYVPGTRMYARLQGALRYSWNPFFKARLAYKTEFLSQMEQTKFPTLLGTNTILASVAPQYYNKIDDVSKLMEANHFFTGGFTGEFADAQAAGATELTSRLTRSQRRSISTLVMAQADRVGMTPEEFLKNYGNNVKDTVETILHYDPRSSFLNSPMVRTINMAFFPFRFNVKVSTQMAKFIGKQPIGIQMATMMGLYRAHDFLNSTEGQQWYSQNSDIIKLFTYFSPLETVSSIAEFLGGAQHGDPKEMVGAMGQLGGLPFGWIPSLLAAEGMVNYQPSYIDPGTGKVAQQWIPINSRGRMSAALSDFIGQLFSFPGSQLGLTSKTKLDVGFANTITGSKSTDFNKRTPPITPEQQQFQAAVQSLHPNQTLQPAPAPTPQSATQSFKPSTDLLSSPLSQQLRQQVYKSSSRTAKKKKADYTPWMLPGQEALGQLQ